MRGSCIYILVVRICQTSKVRTKADTAMNSNETSHPRGHARGSVAQLNLMSKGTPGFAEEENVRGNVELPKAPNTATVQRGEISEASKKR